MRDNRKLSLFLMLLFALACRRDPPAEQVVPPPATAPAPAAAEEEEEEEEEPPAQSTGGSFESNPGEPGGKQEEEPDIRGDHGQGADEPAAGAAPAATKEIVASPSDAAAEPATDAVAEQATDGQGAAASGDGRPQPPPVDGSAALRVFEEVKKLLEKEKLEAAIELLEEWLKREPGDLVNRRNLIHILLKSGRQEAALFHLRFMVQAEPDNAEWSAHLARTQAQTADYAGAVESFSQALAKRPDDLDLMLDLARSHASRKDWDKAREVLLKGLATGNRPADFHRELAAVLVELGEYRGAWDSFRQLQKLEPTYDNALRMAKIASQYERCDDVRDALADWEKDFVDETPHLLLGACAIKAREPVTAQRHLMKGLAANDKCYYCALWLGDIYFESMDWEKAAKIYATAAPLNPQDFRPFNQLGKTLANSGKFIEASRAFEKAAERKPGDADILFGWAMNLVRAGQKADAWKVWGELDKLNKEKAAEVRALLVQ